MRDDDKTRLYYLNKILDSQVFKSDPKSRRLLEYLYDCSKNNLVPKEYEIAVDFFNKEQNFNPAEDTTVRYRMYKLRNKLVDYYHNEGKNDAVWLEIPKGQYRLLFEEKRKSAPMRLRPALLYGIIFLLLGYIGFLHVRQHPVFSNAFQDSIWATFLSDSTPIRLVFGDFFIFEEYDRQLQRYRRIMDYDIQTEHEFAAFQRSYPNRVIKDLPLTELPHNSIFNFNQLLPVFSSFNAQPEITLSSRLTSDELFDQHILFIGEFNQLGILEQYVNNLSVYFSKEKGHRRELIVLDAEGDTLHTFNIWDEWPVGRENLDYALMAKVPGFGNEQYFIIACFGYIALMESVAVLADPARLEAFEKRLLNEHNPIPTYFAAILEITGFEHTSLNHELMYFKAIDKPAYLENNRDRLRQEQRH